ncbi:HVA1 family protein [Salinicola avicenniae]|uniref:HVA1 family protein n=1 Tax=Salinicola avicenniae TaxID=2916836 RepID=UPI002073E744|nr:MULTISPECIES: HVA1 family protein [unclassified Salinicola]
MIVSLTGYADHWARKPVARECHETVTRKLQGSEVTRNGAEDNPAYRIKQDDGTRVPKLHSEWQKGSPGRST